MSEYLRPEGGLLSKMYTPGSGRPDGVRRLGARTNAPADDLTEFLVAKVVDLEERLARLEQHQA